MYSSKLFYTSLFFLFIFSARSQPKSNYSTGEIVQRLEKLNTLGSVLYIAAHPDDENTQLISYFANGLHMRTAYLAATRGGGGQNLIGSEIQQSLGIIRTQELLAARAIDGGEQFFSRAIDFGYSKEPNETFNKWNKQEVLADFVWTIRKFRPDVIVTRFNTDPGTTHGHHTASAILAQEAYELSADPKAFPEQLNYVDVWQVKKLFWNTSTWFFSRNNQTFNPDDYVKVDVGAYNPYLGQSYTEISALSRSMHKSQGFGRSSTRGSEFEYLQQWEGPRSDNMFDDIDFSWNRIEGTERISYQIEEALLNFDPSNPSSIVPNLIEARKEIELIKDEFWKGIKLKEVDELICSLTGTFLEFVADQSEYAPGDTISIDFEAINRSNTPIVLAGVSFSRWSDNFIYNIELPNNQVNTLNYSLVFSKRVPISNPYWLDEPGSETMFKVSDQEKIGLPENPPVILATVKLKIEGEFLEYQIPVVYKETDRVKGEVNKPIAVTPEVMVNIDKRAVIYSDDQPKEIAVNLISGKNDISGDLKLKVPSGWRSEPGSQPFEMTRKGEEQVFHFKLFPSKNAAVATISAVATVDGISYNRGKEVINYDHIPKQIQFPLAETRVVKLDLQKQGERIGYIMGAGDEVPYSLEQIGYQVELLDKDQIMADNLMKYDAVIVGIRAFNTNDWLTFKNKELFDYTDRGGTVIVQYNTAGTVTDELAPYFLKLSRDRVAVEDAEMRMLVKKHEVLNRPNKISNQDFENWVQERGLYFPNEWDEKFEAILSANDPGEEPRDGSLLVAKYGKGYYIYTGLSFFRELPAGVPGAYRLMANMISIGKDTKSK